MGLVAGPDGQADWPNQQHLAPGEDHDALRAVDKDWVERKGKDGETELVLDREHIQRSKLRAEHRRWLFSKALPKVYGDKER